MKHRFLVWSLVLALVTFGQSPAVTAVTPACTTASACVNNLKHLQDQLSANQQALTQKQQAAANLQSVINDLNGKIASLTGQIQDTQGRIDAAAKQIADLTASIDADTAKLGTLKSQIDDTYVMLYEISQTSGLENMIGSPSISQLYTRDVYIQSVADDLSQKIHDLTQLQNDLQVKRTTLQEQQDSLVASEHDLQTLQQNLSSQKAQQNNFLKATATQITSYIADQTQIKQQISDVEKRLSVLIATASWGTDIVSAPPAGWYYSQLNYSATLGNSPYTVHDYGCLVTSFAMLATYYGHPTTPADIARHASFFDSAGDAYISPLADGIGLSIAGSGPVNWYVVDQELANNHPVIVSIYLPQVGAINNDGSSHFIVLQAKVGNQYLMQDPLGPGRSYGFANVRSMILVRPQ